MEEKSGGAVAARLSAFGTSALGLIGIAGPGAVAIAEALFRSRSGASLEKATVRPIYGDFGREISDDVVLCIRPAVVPEVYVYCHGGRAIVDALLAQIVAEGARLVEWPEYCKLRGESAIAIEARIALNNATTLSAANVLLTQLSGALDRGMQKAAAGDLETIETMLGWARFGLHLANPWKVMMFGHPNVGKSSLLNALVGYSRAIVADAPGTTRDIVGGVAILGNWAFELLDGAGLRQTDDPIEQAGQALLLETAREADLRILILDLSLPRPVGPDSSIIDGLPIQADLVVGNKSDLPTHWSAAEQSILDVRCSAKTGEGIGDLADAIVRRLVPRVPAADEAIPFTPRQVEELERLRSRFARGSQPSPSDDAKKIRDA